MITDLPTALRIAHEFSVAGLPKAVQSLPKRTLSLCKEKGLLPTYVNQTENKSLMIEYSAVNWYLAVVFWPDGEIDLYFKQGTALTRWALTAPRYTVKLKSVLRLINQSSLPESIC